MNKGGIYLELKNRFKLVFYVVILLLSLGNIVFATGNIKDQVNQGNFYYEEGNYDMAEKYWKIASDQGDLEAQNNLGILYEEQKKYDLAEKYYKMAADEGLKDAQYNLGLFYSDQGKKELSKKYEEMVENNKN